MGRWFFFFFSSTNLLLPTHLPPPSCTHAQSCNPMDFSPPDTSVHGLFQARILEWVAISFSREDDFLIKVSWCMCNITGTLSTFKSTELWWSVVLSLCCAPGADVVYSLIILQETKISIEKENNRSVVTRSGGIGGRWSRGTNSSYQIGNYSPWGHKESDTTDWLSAACVLAHVRTHTCTDMMSKMINVINTALRYIWKLRVNLGSSHHKIYIVLFCISIVMTQAYLWSLSYDVYVVIMLHTLNLYMLNVNYISINWKKKRELCFIYTGLSGFAHLYI